MNGNSNRIYLEAIDLILVLWGFLVILKNCFGFMVVNQIDPENAELAQDLVNFIKIINK